MTQQDEIETEQRPLVSFRTRKVVGVLLLANVVTYGLFWVLLHGMAASQ